MRCAALCQNVREGNVRVWYGANGGCHALYAVVPRASRRSVHFDPDLRTKLTEFPIGSRDAIITSAGTETRGLPRGQLPAGASVTTTATLPAQRFSGQRRPCGVGQARPPRPWRSRHIERFGPCTLAAGMAANKVRGGPGCQRRRCDGRVAPPFASDQGG